MRISAADARLWLIAWVGLSLLVIGVVAFLVVARKGQHEDDYDSIQLHLPPDEIVAEWSEDFETLTLMHNNEPDLILEHSEDGWVVREDPEALERQRRVKK